jgi:hypothetical protein
MRQDLLRVFEVHHRHVSVGSLSVCRQVEAAPQQSVFFGTLVDVFLHAHHEVASLLESRCERPQWMVDCRTNQENCDTLGSRFRAKSSIIVRQLRREFASDYALGVWVRFNAREDEKCVDNLCSDDDNGDEECCSP